MIKIVCPECENEIKLPSISEILKLKGSNTAFEYNIECCEKKKLKILLDGSNRLNTSFVDI